VRTAQVVPAAEPAPIERPRAPKPVRNERKHQADSNLRSVKSEPDPAPAPPPRLRCRRSSLWQPRLPRRLRRAKARGNPRGDLCTGQMIDGVDSSLNHAGEMFHASLAAPITVDDQIVVQQGPTHTSSW